MVRPLLALVALAACTNDSAPDEVEVAACANLETGPFQDITAGPDPVTDLSIEIDDDDVAYRVALGTTGGYVFFGATAPADYLFALDTDVAVTFTTQAGDPIEPATTASSSSACSDIHRMFILSLDTGTYFLELAPDADTATIVVEPYPVEEE